MIQNSKPFILFIFLLVFTSIANAQSYISLGGGSTALDIDIDTEDSNGFILSAGFTDNRNYGLEISYVNLGTFDVTQQAANSLLADVISGLGGLPVGATASAEASYKITGLDLALVFHMPVTNKLNFTGRLGSFSWTSEVKTTVEIQQGSTVASDSNRQTTRDSDLSYSLGASYNITDVFGINVDYRQFAIGRADVDFSTISLSYSF